MRGPSLSPSTSSDRPRAPWLLLALAIALAPGACDAIVGAGDRKLDTSIECDDAGCRCAIGHGDCDGEPDNGCETDLEDPDNCGACGNVCSNGKCEDLACVCEGSFGDCDGDPTTICETNLAESADHCGLCGRSCGGEPCEEGLCVPSAVGTAPVYSFILVGDTFYLAPYDSPGIHKMSVEGGAAQQVGTDVAYAFALAAQGTSIYWTTQSDVRATSTITGQTTTLVTQTKPWQEMAIGGGKVYWAEMEGTPQNPGDLHLKRTTLAAGGEVEEMAVLGDGLYAHDFVATTTHVYWSKLESILRATHESLAATTFFEAPTTPTYLTLTTDALLFAGLTSGTYLLPLDDGDLQQLADLPGYGPFAADDDNIYFITAANQNAERTLWRVPRGGGDPLKLAADPDPGPPRIAVDEAWVYWVGGSNLNIQRVAK